MVGALQRGLGSPGDLSGSLNHSCIYEEILERRAARAARPLPGRRPLQSQRPPQCLLQVRSECGRIPMRRSGSSAALSYLPNKAPTRRSGWGPGSRPRGRTFIRSPEKSPEPAAGTDANTSSSFPRLLVYVQPKSPEKLNLFMCLESEPSEPSAQSAQWYFLWLNMHHCALLCGHFCKTC